MKSLHGHFQVFVLEGFRSGLETQAMLFTVFLALYMVTILGNFLMIIFSTLDACLHFPMYFFLKNFSFVDLCYSSLIAPMHWPTSSPHPRSSPLQNVPPSFSFYLWWLPLNASSWVLCPNHFMVICSPLRYPRTMCQSACTRRVLGAYCGGCFNSVVQRGFTFKLSFCSSNRINHFFCDVPPLLQITCGNMAINELLFFGICGLIIVGVTFVVLISYGYIIVTVLKMGSGAGRCKVFSTCGSHMTAVTLFFGTVFVMYAQPGAIESMEQGKLVSVFYMLVIPMLNPLIYSLRNKDVKEAVWRLGQKHMAT